MNDGRKDDKGKLRRSLLPQRAHQEVLKVLEYGAQKYGADNWRTLENLQVRYDDAAGRHEDANRLGETLDPESGLPHLAHAICSLYFALEDQMLAREWHGIVDDVSDVPTVDDGGERCAQCHQEGRHKLSCGVRTGQLAVPGTFREAGEEH